MGTKSTLLLSLAGCAVCRSLAAAQLPDVKVWRLTDTSQVVDLAIASSGGVSIGAYQAGASWMFAELVKFMRDNPAQRARFRLPSFRIAALSGASAGNINSLLLALQSCDASPAGPAERSALWDIWTQMGMSQLLPEKDGHGRVELGLLDRSLLSTVTKARLKLELGRPAIPDCFIPIVAMMSKLAPSQFQLNRLMGASVQRYVASYSLAGERLAGTPGWHFVLRAPEPLVQRDTALGKQVSLVSNGGELEGYYEADQVFELMRASSSVIYLFAPTPLAYCEANAAADAGGCNAAASPGARVERAMFVDGGVTDNTPLFAGMRLMVLRDSLAGAGAARFGRRDHGTIFVSYGARRGHEAPGAASAGVAASGTRTDGAPASCQSPQTAERCGGIGALLQFMNGFVAASTQYEMQWLIRLRAHDPILRNLDVDVTTRYSGIVGERLKNASSFLGRPFREFDFQVGIYDALHFVANAILCLPEHRQRSDSLGMDRCVVDTVRGLVDRFPLSCQSSLAVDLLLRKEYGIESSEGLRNLQLRETAHCDDTSRESTERALAYRSIFEALEFVDRQPSHPCQGRGTISASLCADGMIALFERLRDDASFRRYVDGEAAACRRRVAAAAGAERRLVAARCFADDEFAGALRDPQRAFFTWLRRLLERAQWLEEEVAHQSTDGDRLLGLDAATQTMNLLVRTALLTEDLGFTSFPTIVPRRRNAWRVLTGLVVPQEIAIETMGSGSGYYWRPAVWRWGNGMAASATTGIIRNTFASAGDTTMRTRSQSRGMVSLLAGYRPMATGSPLLSEVAAGARYWMPSRRDDDARTGRNLLARWSPELKVDLLWDRLSVRLSRNPGFGAVEERRRLRASVSLNDFGGVLYWILRSPTLR